MHPHEQAINRVLQVTHLKVTLHVQHLIANVHSARKRHIQDRYSWQRIDGVEILIEFDPS